MQVVHRVLQIAPASCFSDSVRNGEVTKVQDPHGAPMATAAAACLSQLCTDAIGAAAHYLDQQFEVTDLAPRPVPVVLLPGAHRGCRRQ